MSGAGFHVHGPHDHELEHATQHAASGARRLAGGSMINQIAMFTAVIATVGAIFSYMGGATQANAGLYKNNAAIKKTEASNQWNYFQAKSTQAVAGRGLARPAAGRQARPTTRPRSTATRRKRRRSRLDAEKLEAEATDWDKQSDEQMHQHHRWAQATTALQVSIALAAIALLTRRSGWSRACSAWPASASRSARCVLHI